MPKIAPGDKEIDSRAKAAVKDHHDTIVKRFCDGAKKKGYDIKPGDVTGVTYKGLDKLTFDFLGLKLGRFVIENDAELKWLDGTRWDNNASTEGLTSFVVNETTTDSFTWQMTAGFAFKASTTEKLEIGVPGAKGEVSVTLGIETSVSTTSGVAHSSTHAWQRTFSQPVAAYHHYEMAIYAKQVRGHVPFTLTSQAKGDAVIEIAFRYSGKRTHTAKVALSELLGQKGSTITSEGVVSGLQGYDWEVTSEDRDLTGAERKALPPGLHEVHATRLKLGKAA